MELLACCGMADVAVSAPRVENLLRQEIDWTLLVRLALAHGMSLLLARGLEHVAGQVPPDILEALRSHLEDNRARNLTLVRFLFDLVDALGSIGVDAIPFKGPVLGAVAYGDFSLRRAGDLDILVRPNDVSRVCHWLSGAGFRELTEVWTGRPLSALEDAAYRRHQCEYEFVRQSDDVVVDLHWAIAPAALAVPLDYPALWRRSRRECLLDRQVPALAHEDLLVLLSIHGTKHEWAELRWISDLAGMIARHPGIDLEAALARAFDWGCGRMLLVGLGLGRRLLGMELSHAVARRVDEDHSVAALVRGISTRLLRGKRVAAPERVSLLLIRIRERRRDQVRYVARTLLTPRVEHMRLLPLPGPARGLYVPIKLACDVLLDPLWRVTKRVQSLAERATKR